MQIPIKLSYAKRHIDSILTHDDETIEVRAAAASELLQHINAGLAAAQGRESPELAKRREARQQLAQADLLRQQAMKTLGGK